LNARLNNQRYLADPRKAATLYLTNHDHSHVAWPGWRARQKNPGGGGGMSGTASAVAIARLTAPGAPMLQSGRSSRKTLAAATTAARVAASSRPCAGSEHGPPIVCSVRAAMRAAAHSPASPGLRSTDLPTPITWAEWQTQLNPAASAWTPAASGAVPSLGPE